MVILKSYHVGILACIPSVIIFIILLVPSPNLLLCLSIIIIIVLPIPSIITIIISWPNKILYLFCMITIHRIISSIVLFFVINSPLWPISSKPIHHPKSFIIFSWVHSCTTISSTLGSGRRYCRCFLDYIPLKPSRPSWHTYRHTFETRRKITLLVSGIFFMFFFIWETDLCVCTVPSTPVSIHQKSLIMLACRYINQPQDSRSRTVAYVVLLWQGLYRCINVTIQLHLDCMYRILVL